MGWGMLVRHCMMARHACCTWPKGAIAAKADNNQPSAASHRAGVRRVQRPTFLPEVFNSLLVCGSDCSKASVACSLSASVLLELTGEGGEACLGEKGRMQTRLDTCCNACWIMGIVHMIPHPSCYASSAITWPQICPPCRRPLRKRPSPHEIFANEDRPAKELITQYSVQ